MGINGNWLDSLVLLPLLGWTGDHTYFPAFSVLPLHLWKPIFLNKPFNNATLGPTRGTHFRLISFLFFWLRRWVEKTIPVFSWFSSNNSIYKIISIEGLGYEFSMPTIRVSLSALNLYPHLLHLLLNTSNAFFTIIIACVHLQ